MCEGIKPDIIPLSRINPQPEIGDIWSLQYDNFPAEYYLILDINGRTNATIMNLCDGYVEDYFAVESMLESACWKREA